MGEPTKADLEARIADLEAEREEHARLLTEGAGLADRLLAENEQLRGQSAVKPTGEHQAAARRPYLTEAERAELELSGRTTSPFTGQVLTREQVLQELAGSDTQQAVEIAEPSPGLVAQLPKPRERAAIEGVDYVWPSVAPGVLASAARVDPAGNARLPGNVVG